ncbi:MAG: hypothetical protein AB1649_22520 [Chloroflexota bacterium]
MTDTYYKLGLRARLTYLLGLVILLTLFPVPDYAYAQWPPFKFRLDPSYEEGRITYQIRFSGRVEWAMRDVAFKIPLPAGTRFLKAGAPSMTSVNFDGVEITFFTAVFHEPIKDAYFIVEVTDPAATVVTTHAWIAWQGDQPGDYLTEEVSLDITLPPLNWEQPPDSRVQLEAIATVVNNVVTYAIYPTNVTKDRIWDLKVNVPIPDGSTFLSAQAPSSFVTSFNGREVSFSTIELESRAKIGPLSVKVFIIDEITSPSLATTHAWATWKNVGKKVGQRIVAQDETRTSNIVVQSHSAQQVVSDKIGDVPFSNYDLTGIAFQEDEGGLKVDFHTAGPIGPVGEPLEYLFYIDNDCRADTGEQKRGLGLEYRVRYKHSRGKADISLWVEAETEGEDQGSESGAGSIKVSSPADGQTITVWVPYNLLNGSSQFCWFAEARNKTGAFASRPPTDRIPNDMDQRFTQYVALDTVAEALTSAAMSASLEIRDRSPALAEASLDE